MAYKVDSEKGYRILRCLTPPRILINSPPFTNAQDFANKFKSEGFSVLCVSDLRSESNQAKIKNIWDRNSNNPIIIQFYEPDIKIILDLFKGNYSYVYLYPNNPKEYSNQVIEFLESDLDASSVTVLDPNLINTARKSKKETNSFIKNLLDNNRNTYKEHCTVYDDKVFTILI
jgi:hypothetical protein